MDCFLVSYLLPGLGVLLLHGGVVGHLPGVPLDQRGDGDRLDVALARAATGTLYRYLTDIA